MRARVLPEWLDACFPDHAPAAAQRALACRSCLRGWMARIEREAAPSLESMIAGYPFVLAVQNQQTVATWAAKTILTLQAVRDDGLLPAGAYDQLRTSGRPPAGFGIALALRPRGDRWPYRFTASGSAATLRPWDVEPTFDDTGIDHYRAELCLGHLVIQAAARFTPHARPFDHDGAVAIWPARTPVCWPPARSIARRLRQAA